MEKRSLKDALKGKSSEEIISEIRKAELANQKRKIRKTSSRLVRRLLYLNQWSR